VAAKGSRIGTPRSSRATGANREVCSITKTAPVG
jgi:hypothetical protein